MNVDKKSVVLCSGGMDSVTVVNLVVQQTKPTNITVLFVSYGQKTVKREREFSKIAASRIGANWLEVEFPDLSKITKSSLIHEKEYTTEVQGRNTILIGLGAALAQTIKAEELYIGIQSADVIYGDAQPLYFEYISKAIKVAYNVTVLAPLLFKSKKEIIQIAREINLDLQMTYSCYFNDIEPCGDCPSCKVRLAAEKELL
jgi:7-cyano-7-deazaguanine synthase